QSKQHYKRGDSSSSKADKSHKSSKDYSDSKAKDEGKRQKIDMSDNLEFDIDNVDSYNRDILLKEYQEDNYNPKTTNNYHKEHRDYQKDYYKNSYVEEACKDGEQSEGCKKHGKRSYPAGSESSHKSSSSPKYQVTTTSKFEIPENCQADDSECHKE